MADLRLVLCLFRSIAILCVLSPLGQARAQTDSLWSVWNNKSLPDSARLKAISALSWKAVFEKPDSGIALAEMQLTLALKSNDARARFTAYNTLAVGNKLRSDLYTALSYFEQCLAVAQEMKDRSRVANTYSNMSTVYKDLGDQPKALNLLQQSLHIDEELGNKEGIAGTYNNIGNIYKRLNEFEKALENYEKSAALYNELGNEKGRANVLVSLGAVHNQMGDRLKAAEELLLAIDLYKDLGIRSDLGKAHNNLGQVFGDLKRPQEAFEHLDEAERIFTELGLLDPLSRCFYYKGEVMLDQGRAREAIAVCSRGAAIADSLGLLAQRRECSDCLMRAYALVGDFRRAYEAQHLFLQIDDSLDRLNDSKEVTRLELTREFQQRQITDSLTQARAAFERDLENEKKVTREKNRRNIFLFSSIVVLVLAGALLSRLRYTNRAKNAIEREKERSDELLHNILPEEVAAELKAKGSADARVFDEATVLFTDFKGFTQMAETLRADELVAEIDACFKGLDMIVEHHGIEKIKTIGDAYMAAAGLPDPTRSSARDMVLAALEMQEFIQRRRTERLSLGRPAFEMRVGIHTGPVIAGIVGVKKFQYDIWGDVVNIAARMESSGEPGRVNISAATYALVKDVQGLRFEPRGRIEAKNKGDLEMFFVSRS